jgi:hypothetical protein
MELVSVLAQHDKLQACVDALGAHLRLRDSGEVRRASSSLDAPWSLPGAEAPGTHTHTHSLSPTRPRTVPTRTPPLAAALRLGPADSRWVHDVVAAARRGPACDEGGRAARRGAGSGATGGRVRQDGEAGPGPWGVQRGAGAGRQPRERAARCGPRVLRRYCYAALPCCSRVRRCSNVHALRMLLGLIAAPPPTIPPTACPTVCPLPSSSSHAEERRVSGRGRDMRRCRGRQGWTTLSGPSREATATATATARWATRMATSTPPSEMDRSRTIQNILKGAFTDSLPLRAPGGRARGSNLLGAGEGSRAIRP